MGRPEIVGYVPGSVVVVVFVVILFVVVVLIKVILGMYILHAPLN